MADPVQGVQVVIDEPDDSVRVDPVTGTVETDQDDGGVVVQFDARRPKTEAENADFYRNIVEDIPALTLSQLANDLHEQIAADDQSRQNTLQIRARAMELLGLEIKDPRANVGDTSASIEGMSTVTNPLLLEACLKGWANAEAELLPSEGPVKIDDSGVTSESEDELAEAFERDVNYFYTDIMTEYYPDTSHMLLWSVYFGGAGIKKIYRCPLLRRPTSQSIDIKDFIVSDTTKDLKSCARITHQVEMRPSVLKRMQLAGAYRQLKLAEPSPPQVDAITQQVAAIQGTNPAPQRPENQPYILWESQCELDLPEFTAGKFKGKGIPLPYLVTLDKESKEVLAIRRDWRQDDEECRRKRMFVRFPYIPGPGFYGTGLLNILGNSSAAMTAAWRLALDNAMFANFPSGLIAKLTGRQNTSDIRQGPGTLTPIETNGQPIGNVVAPNPYRDVTPGMLSLMDKITAQAQSVGGTGDIPTAEGVQNVPVGTMLAQIEQATKVIAAAHRGQYKAQAEEMVLIIELLRDNPDDFLDNIKGCNNYEWTEARFLQAIDDCNLIPRADPNTPSHIHRVAKALALAQLIAVPAFTPIMDPRGTLNRILAVIREQPEGIVLPPAAPQPPQPNPQLIAANAKDKQATASILKAQTDGAKAQADTETKLQEGQTERDIATTNLAKEMVIHKDDAAQSANEHGLATAQAVHDASLGLAQHALDVQKVTNPPPDGDSGGLS